MKIKVGDKLPSSELFYLDQSNNVKKIDILDLCRNNKTIILGMPGAFTKTCSTLHLPSFINNYDLALKKRITKIVCVAVNDPNVMKAWGENQNVGDKIFMAADPYCEFTKAIGAEIDRNERGLGIRSARYTMLVEDNIIKTIKAEEDTANCEISAAEISQLAVSSSAFIILITLSSTSMVYLADLIPRPRSVLSTSAPIAFVNSQ